MFILKAGQDKIGLVLDETQLCFSCLLSDCHLSSHVPFTGKSYLGFVGCWCQPPFNWTPCHSVSSLSYTEYLQPTQTVLCKLPQPIKMGQNGNALIRLLQAQCFKFLKLAICVTIYTTVLPLWFLVSHRFLSPSQCHYLLRWNPMSGLYSVNLLLGHLCSLINRCGSACPKRLVQWEGEISTFVFEFYRFMETSAVPSKKKEKQIFSRFTKESLLECLTRGRKPYFHYDQHLSLSYFLFCALFTTNTHTGNHSSQQSQKKPFLYLHGFCLIPSSCADMDIWQIETV